MRNLKTEIKRIEIERLRKVKTIISVFLITITSPFTLHPSPCFSALTSGDDYNVVRLQTGGVGSQFCETDDVKLYHSFSQSSPVGIDAVEDIKLISGYLSVNNGGSLMVVGTSPTAGSLGVMIPTTIKVYFDGEVSSDTINDSVSMMAIRDKDGAKISENVPINIQHITDDNYIKITPQQTLQNNHQYQITVSTTLKETSEDLPLQSSLQMKFTTIFSPQDNNVVVIDDNEKLKIEIPPQSFQNYFHTDVSTEPITSPIKIEPERIKIADSKAIADESDRRLMGHYEIESFDSDKNRIDTKATKNLHVSLPFGKVQSAMVCQNAVGRRSSSSASMATKPNINLYRLNEDKKLWVRIPDTSLDYENQTINATVLSLGTFAIFTDPRYELSEAYAYPVPFSPNENPAHKSITFTGLATRCTIKVFTINGELVDEFEHPSANSINESEYEWSVVNKDGDGLASGVYLYLIESKYDKKVGKLMVIK